MGTETVKTHLSHVYDKLGIRNRATLTTELSNQATNGGRP
jgi:DNA-binding CsgD family transcriptional regulator